MSERTRNIIRNVSLSGAKGLRGKASYVAIAAVACVFLGTLVLGGCGDGSKPNAQGGPAGVPVTYVVASPERVELTMELSGRTSAVEMADVRPQVNGIVLERLFTEGADVKKGQQLYQIDPALYQAALNEARAAVNRAQANMKTTGLLAARYGKVVGSKAVSRQEYDNAVAAYNQARADVASARAAVETATINLRYTKVYSPIDGHIGISSVTPGALVTANQTQPLATVQRLDEMYIDLTQSSADILRLKRSLMEGKLKPAAGGGAEVSLKLEDGSDYAHKGELQLADVTVDRGTGTVTVRAKFPNPKEQISSGKEDRLLFPGMFVRAVLQEAVDENAILLPIQAVGRDTMGRPTVYVINDGGTVVEEVVVLDRSIGKRYLIRSGVQPGQKIIVDGRVKVRPGAKVQGTELPAQSQQDAAKPAPEGSAPDAAKTDAKQ